MLVHGLKRVITKPIYTVESALDIKQMPLLIGISPTEHRLARLILVCNYLR